MDISGDESNSCPLTGGKVNTDGSMSPKLGPGVERRHGDFGVVKDDTEVITVSFDTSSFIGGNMNTDGSDAPDLTTGRGDFGTVGSNPSNTGGNVNIDCSWLGFREDSKPGDCGTGVVD